MLLLTVGCAYQPNPQSDVFQDSYDIVPRLAEQQAPYEFECPMEEMKFINVAHRVIGVEGCGKRATYTFVSGAGWIMNSGDFSRSGSDTLDTGEAPSD